MRPFGIALLALACASATRPAAAEIALAPLFRDHAVLQCDQPLPVWGRADPGEKIAVTFRGETVHATTAKDGRWIVYLPPVAASGEPAELTVAGQTTVVVRDVVVGEVWLASGQSNMEWPVANAHESERQLAEADLPLVRQLKIERTSAGAPADTVATGGWQAASPRTVGGFSAVAFFFARELHRKLGVPIGIVNSTWGGTEIEAWMSDASRASTTLGAAIDARWQKALAEWPPERVARYPELLAAWQKADAHARATKTKNPLPWPQPPATPDSPRRPGGLFNGMIAPLQPAAIRGVIWYQGESNVARAGDYPELFKTMIAAWRASWGDDRLPFYFVQLPNFAAGNRTGRQWPRLREAQARALELPATGMAVTIDAGEADDLHPPRKLEVGRRLALIAKTQVYGVPGDFSGPIFAGVERAGRALRVRFAHAEAGLVAHDRPVQSLELAGADKVFHPATAAIDRGTLVVSSPQVPEPVAVRYAWTNAPAANLYNGAGLPAAPFRSDDW